ncbi:hypothetical protein [Heyndrickxia vini]|uniref:Uncharacterized protein n=1 Tax=Heyndrickxia vini TaxID=1476025 RepID=A0ABX7E3W8_9BACI|nr:hypothetical protein [Heyndrickxia vini]QQZ10003.1 hypothetical protein I5776_03275 [Heyndrickxia vini]
MVIGSKVQKGYQLNGDMDYVQVTDYSTTPGTYVVKIKVIDNAGNISEIVTKELVVPSVD